MGKIVGREKELSLLDKLYHSHKSEFIAVYGRRRVGKTYLIRSAFENKFTFQITGLANISSQLQLANFNLTINTHQKNNETINLAEDWITAFVQLINFLETKIGKKVIFIDELPWFDTRNSKFIQGLEHFWNSWASARNDVILIVCGSTTSWMVNKLINNKGGLHNRITKTIKLNPFNLFECEKYLKNRNIELDRYQIIQLYMSIGGIPFYWDEIQAGKSAFQNIEEVCFTETGLLKNEFNNLFPSLFKKSENHVKIISAMAKKAMGLTRDEIVKLSDLPNAGSTTRVLDELEQSGFIRKYQPFGKKLRNSLYQLVDFYSLFYFKFIKNTSPIDKNNWINTIDSPKYRAWSGYPYEQICLHHIPQIKQKLGISGVYSEVSSWRRMSSDNGDQIDLVIDRRDQVINLCEVKFSINPYTITKKYASELRNKIGLFKTETSTRKSVFLCMLTTYGILENQHSLGLVQNDIKMDALFLPET